MLDQAAFQRAACRTDEKGWKQFLRELRFQKLKRKTIKASMENRPVEVNVKGIERLLQGK